MIEENTGIPPLYPGGNTLFLSCLIIGSNFGNKSLKNAALGKQLKSSECCEINFNTLFSSFDTNMGKTVWIISLQHLLPIFKFDCEHFNSFATPALHFSGLNRVLGNFWNSSL